MVVLTGDTRSKKLVSLLQEHGWGRMVIDRGIRPYPGEKWGFDNGAFRDWRKGKRFDETAFLRRLDIAYIIGTPYIAVTPDIVAGGERSLEFSLSWVERLPKEWPWYLAVQDDMNLEQVDKVLQYFAGIFLGGTDLFKGTAWYWCQLAHRQGKRFHYGRAGTPGKIRKAMAIGADSCDSAFPLWTRDRMDVFVSAWKRKEEQVTLWGPEVWAIRP